MDQDFLLFFKNLRIKFNIYDLLPIRQHITIIFHWPQNAQAESVINWPPGSRSASVSQDYRSAEPVLDPKEIFTLLSKDLHPQPVRAC